MRYIFAIVLSLVLSSTSLAAAAAADAAPANERIAVAQHIKRLAQNNILWLEGFHVSLDSLRSGAVDSVLAADISIREQTIKSISSFKDFIEQEQRCWQLVIARTEILEGSIASIDDFKILINYVLPRIPIFERAIHSSSAQLTRKQNLFNNAKLDTELACKKDAFIKAKLDNARIQKRDYESILRIVLPFTDNAYQRDCALFKPIFNSARKKAPKFFTFNKDNTALEINEDSGVHVTIPLEPLPSITINNEDPSNPCVVITFESGLLLLCPAPKESMVELAGLDKAIAEVKAKAIAHAKAVVEIEKVIAEEEAREPKRKGGKGKSSKKGDAGGVGISESGSAAAAAKPASEALSPAFAGAGASGSAAETAAPSATEAPTAAAGAGAAGGSGMDPALKAKTLAWAYGHSVLPPLSSYASVGGVKAASMDKDDRAMLANLLKINNGDGTFGPTQKANAYNWANLKLLLAHLEFVETRDNCEFTYNGNSIKLHYIHWSHGALDDKLLNIMFRQFANIGLTEEVLKGMLGIAPAGAGAAV